MQPTLLEEFRPSFDVRDAHDRWIAAPPAAVFAAVTEVTVGEVRLLAPLEALRGLPSLAAVRLPARLDCSAPVLDAFTVGAVQLGVRPGTEVAVGAVGRFWRLTGNEPARF